MAGEQTVKRILPLLAALLVASCSSSEKGPAGKGQVAAQDEKYDQALEYYALTHEPGADANDLTDGKPRSRQASEIDPQTARRMLSLQEAIRSWRIEKPDAGVPGKDRKAVKDLVERVFQDPASRGRMVIKTCELKLCEKVSYRFYSKNRCLVSITFYNRGPTIQAGLDLYLFKHKDRWQVVHRVDWIG